MIPTKGVCRFAPPTTEVEKALPNLVSFAWRCHSEKRVIALLVFLEQGKGKGEWIIRIVFLEDYNGKLVSGRLKGG